MFCSTNLNTSAVASHDTFTTYTLSWIKRIYTSRVATDTRVFVVANNDYERTIRSIIACIGNSPSNRCCTDGKVLSVKSCKTGSCCCTSKVAYYSYFAMVCSIIIISYVPTIVSMVVMVFMISSRNIESTSCATHTCNDVLTADTIWIVWVIRINRIFVVAADARWSAIAYNYGKTTFNRMRTSISYGINNVCCSKRIMTASIIGAIEIINYRNNFAVVGCCRYWNCKRCIIVVSIGRQRVVARTCYCRIFGITASIFNIWCRIYCISAQVGNCIGISYSPRAIVTRLACCMLYCKATAIVGIQSLNIIIRSCCRSVGIAKVHVFFASRERTSSNQLRSYIILYYDIVCCFVLAVQSIVVANMQLYPVGSVAIVSNSVIIWNNCRNCKFCTILSSRGCSIQSEVAGPCVSVIRSCSLDVGNNFLLSYIRANIAKVWECYYRQRLNGNSNICTLGTIVIVCYFNMVCSCFCRTYSYNITIVRSI